MVDDFADSDSRRSHLGDCLFRSLNYTDTGVDFVQHLALPGDVDGGLKVGFADVLVLSGNFGQPGTWTDGDF